MENKYISIKEASLILGVTKGTLRNWDNSGKLKAHRHPFNNYRVYKTEDIDKILESISNNRESLPAAKKVPRNVVKKLPIQHLES